jgi:hypothetical protein
MSASAVIATNSMYLASEATATARVRHKDGDVDACVEELSAAIESLEQARRALRGW